MGSPEAKRRNSHELAHLVVVGVGSCGIDSPLHKTYYIYISYIYTYTSYIYMIYIYIYIISIYIYYYLLDSSRIYPCLAIACHSNSQSPRHMTAAAQPSLRLHRCSPKCHPESSSQVSKNKPQTYVQSTNQKHQNISVRTQQTSQIMSTPD